MTERPSRSQFARRHPRVYLGLHAAAGFGIAALFAWAFLAMADEVPEKGMMTRVDLFVTNWLQVHGTETGESIFSAISLLGAPILAVVLIGVGIVLLIRRDWRQSLVLYVTCGGGALMNGVLKLIFQRARPSFAAEFGATSWSFPSGHAMDSLIAYGLLAYWVAARFPRFRRVTFAVAVVLIAVIGFSRVYLGVHYLSDVLAGYSAGLVWLIVCITGYRFAERSRVGSTGPDEQASGRAATKITD